MLYEQQKKTYLINALNIHLFISGFICRMAWINETALKKRARFFIKKSLKK
jgi:hypothetical protein